MLFVRLYVCILLTYIRTLNTVAPRSNRSATVLRLDHFDLLTLPALRIQLELTLPIKNRPNNPKIPKI
jgi:hypothetical protein